MTRSLKALLLGAVVLSVPAAALAQTTTITTTTRTERGPVVLTPDQRTTVYKRVVRERQVAPRGATVVEYQVGTRVPREVELRTFDDDVYVDAPSLRRYRYVHVNKQLVLVDPETSEVVEIIAD
jgi:hypothetical protein